MIIKNSEDQKQVLDAVNQKVQDGNVKIEALKIAANEIRTKLKATTESSENILSKIAEADRVLKSADKLQRSEEIRQKIADHQKQL